jgi:hypothetical protein
VGFNLEKFAAAKFEPRTEKVGPEILADGIKSFFDDGDEVCWVVRGLSGREMYYCREAEKRAKTVATALEVLSSQTIQASEFRKAMGLDAKQTTTDMARRLEVLVLGSVSPEIKLEHAVLIAERFAHDFNYLTNKIEVLTGLGYDVVKPPAASQPIPD